MVGVQCIVWTPTQPQTDGGMCALHNVFQHYDHLVIYSKDLILS